MALVAGDEDRLAAELARQSRLLARQLVRFYGALADQLGLHITDLICLATLRDRGRATVGELAAELGLTTGAVSRMVNRLEGGGFVRRTRDPYDARRVIVELAATEAAVGLFARQSADITESVAGMTVTQLRLLLDHIRAQTSISRDAADQVRQSGRAHAVRRAKS
jgi:predicted ArsR family transcriptional regulator